MSKALHLVAVHGMLMSDMAMVQAKGAEVLGLCNHHHAARRQYRAELQAEALDKLQDDVPSDQVRQSSWKTYQS